MSEYPLHFWHVRWSGWMEPCDSAGVEGVYVASAKDVTQWLEVRKRISKLQIETASFDILRHAQEHMRRSLIDALLPTEEIAA